jgi:hypothetical protein
MDSLISELNKVEEISIEPEPKSLIPSWVSIMSTIFIIILIVIVCCMGKTFKHWLTLNLAKTRQTSAASDGLVGVDNTKGVGAAIRVNTSSPSAKNIRISKSLESSKQHEEMEPLVICRITFKERLKQSKNLKRYPASINIPETVKELEKEDEMLKTFMQFHFRYRWKRLS